MSTAKKPTVLCILDGFGLNPNPKANSVALAHKPNYDRLVEGCPHTTLTTHGTRVGLPEGHMGNSEVGHLNIGAGRVVLQWLYRISKELGEGFLSKSQPYKNFLANVESEAAIHLIGLYSEGGVHSLNEHLHLLIDELIKAGRKRIILHIITDGRDTSPTISLPDLEVLAQFLAKRPQCLIGSVSGRFYAMDRDNRWERVKQAYDVIVRGLGQSVSSAAEWISSSHAQKITDEFIEPRVVGNSSPISPQDGVIFFNFRADRMREIVRALSAQEFSGFERGQAPHQKSRILCFTNYDSTFEIPYLFEAVDVTSHLGEVVSAAGLTQLRTAETEKYPHVTYFFNGGTEEPLPGEDRTMLPSPRDVKTYDLKPEMSAHAVKDVVVNAIRAGNHDFIVVNFANCDMVGHTGVLEAAIKAVETVDGCLGEIAKSLADVGGQMLVIADHGNCEQMINYEDGTPHTSHTTYPVPAILVGVTSVVGLRDGGALCDVAPTILEIMGLQQPALMTGRSLIIR